MLCWLKVGIYYVTHPHNALSERNHNIIWGDIESSKNSTLLNLWGKKISKLEIERNSLTWKKDIYKNPK